jgi:hypothetical protein
MTLKKLDDWKIEDGVLGLEFFERNYKYFNFYGGSVELLLQQSKFIASKRMLSKLDTSKVFIQSDFDNALNKMKKKEDNNYHLQFLYS